MRIFTLVMSCLLFTGCKDATKGFEDLADRACTCAEEDAACGDKVLADVVSFAEHNKISDGNYEKITQAGVRLNNCLTATGINQTKLVSALDRMVK